MQWTFNMLEADAVGNKLNYLLLALGFVGFFWSYAGPEAMKSRGGCSRFSSMTTHVNDLGCIQAPEVVQ